MFLVTGATGFIGSHLVDRLVSHGCRVRCLVRKSSSFHYLPSSGVEFTHGDLVTGEGLREALRGVVTVMHLAGVTKALSEEAYFAGNARATENLLACCGDVARFVHVSSLAAAGPSPNGVPLSEEAEPHPVSAYGRAKLASERAVQTSEVAARTVTVRPPVVFGPRDGDVWQIFRTAAHGWMLQIGKQERFFSVVYVKDLVEGLVLAAERANAAGRTYFLAHPKAVSWGEFGAAAAKPSGRRIHMIAAPQGAARAIGAAAEAWSHLSGKAGILSREKVAEADHRFWTCDPSRAREELGFTAKYDLEAAVGETLAWYREAGWLK